MFWSLLWFFLLTKALELPLFYLLEPREHQFFHFNALYVLLFASRKKPHLMNQRVEIFQNYVIVFLIMPFAVFFLLIELTFRQN